MFINKYFVILSGFTLHVSWTRAPIKEQLKPRPVRVMPEKCPSSGLNCNFRRKRRAKVLKTVTIPYQQWWWRRPYRFQVLVSCPTPSFNVRSIHCFTVDQFHYYFFCSWGFLFSIFSSSNTIKRWECNIKRDLNHFNRF